MQIQKGLVKYKDRSDIVCTYGLTEDGKQYYFLDGNALANGNIIASTVLVEAIDPVVVASSVGVIDVNGNVVIPFENKSIKAISDNLLLVEKANSTTPSVVEAIGLRSDPLAATKLVTTAASIKENINNKMGSEGRFIFNDQFSEATIYDINGNNIIEDQYFSFIGMKNNESLYFSKNTAESPVVEYSIVDHMFIAPPEPENPAALDVQNTEVTQDTIETAMAREEKVVGFGAEDITAKDFEAVANVNVVEGGAPVEEPLPVEPNVVDPNAVVTVDSTTNVVENGETSEAAVTDSTTEEVESVIPEEIATDVKEETTEEIVSDENTQEVVSEPVAEEAVEENTEVPVEETNVENAEELKKFTFDDSVSVSDVEDSEESEETVEDFVNNFKSDLFDVDLDSDIFADSALQVDKIDMSDNYSDFSYKNYGEKDTIMEDVASTMTNLINLNRKQRQKIASYEDRFEQAASAHKKIVDKARSQIRDIETLKTKLKNCETIVAKLEAKISVLENKVLDQDRIIASQSHELDVLRPQIEGKEELAKVLADAQMLLEQE